MPQITGLRCTVTGEVFAPDGTIEYFNPNVGQVATLDVLYDYAALRQTADRDRVSASHDTTIWRYRDLLPVQPHTTVPPLAVGWTPLYNTPRLAEAVGLKQAWVKDDGSNPTGSYKDRASIMVVTRALERGVEVVSTASTGNAAAALAGVSASLPHHLRTVIFVPAAAPPAKIAQLQIYGAEVVLIEDNYDTAFDLCYELCVAEGWYCRNTGINPFTTEGKKTGAFEIAEQLNWNAPDAVIVSVGDGSIIGGLHKGFVELHEIGWIERIPRLIGVQAVGSSSLVHAWENDISAVDIQPIDAHTIADSISAGLPRDRVKALRAVRETGGAYIAVTDAAIIEAIPQFGRLTGVFAEPSCAATLAGAKRAVELGYLHPDERTVFVSTGNGLKDVPRAQQSVGDSLRAQPTLEAIRDVLR